MTPSRSHRLASYLDALYGRTIKHRPKGLRLESAPALRGVLGALVLAAIMSSCSNSGSASAPTQTTPPGGSAPVLSSTNSSDSGSDAPLAWFINSYSHDNWVVGSAQERLTAVCMRAKGFGYGASRPEPDTSVNLRLRYGSLSHEQASKYGYLDPPDPTGAGQDNSPIPTDKAGQLAYTAALDGDASHQRTVAIKDPVSGVEYGGQTIGSGCWAEANRQLFGSDNDYIQSVVDDQWLQAAAASTLSRAMATAVVIDATKSWAACMSAGGYSAQSPVEMKGKDWVEPRPGRTELRTAARDVLCRDKAHYDDVVRAADAAAQRAFVEQHSTEVAAARSRHAAYLAGATKVSSAG